MRILITFLLILWSPFGFSDVSIASFNIKHYGWNNGKNVNAVAYIVSQFDLVAIQELMDENELKKLEAILEKKTGKKWSSMSSHPIGRTRYKEQYGFIWNENLEYETGAVVYIDNRDVFEREPMSLQFKSNKTGKSFAIGSVHVVFGDSVSDREYEIKALSDYWDWLGDVYPNVPRILAGDFNMPPNHAYFSDLIKKATPLITSGKTTLSKTDKRYASLYDNLFVEKNKLDVNQYGIYKFPNYLNMTHEVAAKTVSDHVPVYLTLGKKTLSFAETNIKSAPVRNVMSCVDLNKSDAEALSRLTGIGDKRALDIISGRPWKSVDDLQRVNGIGPATVKKIKKDPDLCD